MVKLPTRWSSNPAKDTPVVLYNESDLAYNDADTLFDAIDTELADNGKLAQLWEAPSKIRSLWSANPDYPSGEVYNPIGRTFDTIFSVYDGIAGESPIGTKVPANWSAA